MKRSQTSLVLFFAFFFHVHYSGIAASFSLSDLAGTWYGHEVVTGDAPADDPRWGYGRMEVNTIGQFTRLWNGPGVVNELSEGTIAITSGGEIGIDNEPLVNGIMSEDKETIIFIDGTPENAGNGLVVLVRRKMDQSFTPADFAGTWYGHQIVSGDPLSDDPRWKYGTVEMNTRGSFLATWTSPGNNNEATFGTLQVDSTGQLTLNNNSLTHGVVNDAGDMIVLIDGTLQNQGNGLIILTKRQPAQVFSVNDFQGSWCGYGVVSGDNPPDSPRWNFGGLYADDEGNYTANWNNPNSSGEIFSGTLQITSSGEMMFDNDPLTHGAMNGDKGMFVVINGPGTRNGNVLNVFLRCSINARVLQGMQLLLLGR